MDDIKHLIAARAFSDSQRIVDLRVEVSRDDLNYSTICLHDRTMAMYEGFIISRAKLLYRWLGLPDADMG